MAELERSILGMRRRDVFERGALGMWMAFDYEDISVVTFLG